MAKSRKINPKIEEGQASILKAPGQPTRLPILSLLKDGISRLLKALAGEQHHLMTRLQFLFRQSALHGIA